MSFVDNEWCVSTFVSELKIYTKLNPSTTFVSQPSLLPVCVIKRENWTVKKNNGLHSNEDIRECTQRMNTFTYIGSIRNKSLVVWIYQTDIEDNEFIKIKINVNI
tara:strand:- start:2698 stop:3012 length:315 start_codon:yes stop_codon:yes gene_type:complete